MTHGQGPAAGGLPEERRNEVLHARLDLGETTILGADVPADVYQPMRSAYLTLMLHTPEEAERIYALLIEGGQVFMKMEQTFFAERFAMFRDRFGTSWMIIVERV